MERLTRRRLLKLTAFGAGAAVLTACRPATPAPAPTAEPAAPTKAPAATAVPEPTAVPAPVQPVVVTLVESWFGVPQFQDVVDPVCKQVSAMMQDSGLNVEIRSMILEDHETKYPLLYSSGADFQCAFDAPWHRMPSLRSQGALLALDDLFAEHGQKVIEGVTQKIWDFNKYEGVSYGIPIGYIYNECPGVVLRQDLLEKYGVQPPDPNVGWASVKPFLEAIRDNEPGMIPLATRAYKGDCMADFNQWQQTRTHPAGNENTGIVIPDLRKGQKWVNIEDIEAFKLGGQLLREFWEEHLVPEVPISSDTSISPGRDYFFQGKAAAVVANGMGGGLYGDTKALQAVVPNGRAWAYDMQGYTTGKRRGIGALKQWNFIVFHGNTPREKQIAAVQFWNWLYSGQEQIDLWFFGIEGTNWIKTEPFGYKDPEGVDPARNYRKEWYVSGVQGRFRRVPADAPKEYLEHYEFLTNERNWDFTPYAAFELDIKPIETELASVNAAYDEAAYGWRTGTMPMEESTARFKQMMDAAGRPSLLEKCQQQIDAWIAANQDYIKSFGG
ncbi:MAG: DUF3502 domain-containing protein [Anaerolineae bacterium]|nr:DUF3502 domain-containing protein [Anaerolineae bacterium]